MGEASLNALKMPSPAPSNRILGLPQWGCIFLDCIPSVFNWKVTLHCLLEPYGHSIAPIWLAAGCFLAWGGGPQCRGWGQARSPSCSRWGQPWTKVALKPSKEKGLWGRPAGHLLETESCLAGAGEWVSWLHPGVQQPIPPFLSPLRHLFL